MLSEIRAWKHSGSTRWASCDHSSCSEPAFASIVGGDLQLSVALGAKSEREATMGTTVGQFDFDLTGMGPAKQGQLNIQIPVIHICLKHWGDESPDRAGDKIADCGQ